MLDRICNLLGFQPAAFKVKDGKKWLEGDDVPADGTVGYAKGCFFVKTDGSTGSTLYINEGSASSCDFNAK